MKGFSNKEFETLIEELKSLVGCRLQEVGERKSCFILNFWIGERGLRSWILDLNPRNPMLVELPKPQKAKSPVKKTPITLFLKANLEGRILNSIDWDPTNGRVFNLNFGEEYCIEIRLYSGGANCIAITPGKKLSLRKPIDLKPMEWNFGDGTCRMLSEIYDEYLNQTGGKSETSKETLIEKHKKKLEKAISKLESDIEEKKSADWNGLGNWLLQNQSLKVPEQWVALLDRKLSFMENSQRAFQKAKDLKAKLERAEARLVELKKELELGPKKPSGAKKAPQMQAKVKGRTKTLVSGHSLFVGKNAADNLKILRAASGWDYWMHLRDYPGAHGVIRRNRNEKVPEASLQEAARELVLEHLKKKAVDLKGESFDVLLAEVRYVRPIKGDKLGRVNYSNEKTVLCRFDS